MKLVASPCAVTLDGLLVYTEDEHSFRFDVGAPGDLADRSGPDGVTSLSVGTLQIEVGVASGIVLFVWGLHPRAAWQIAPIGEPIVRPGVVRLDEVAELRRGVSMRLAPVGAWTTTFDHMTGWVRVARVMSLAPEETILVATGTALGLREGQLESVWLQPLFE